MCIDETGKNQIAGCPEYDIRVQMLKLSIGPNMRDPISRDGNGTIIDPASICIECYNSSTKDEDVDHRT
jgi:hypothetical protein